MTYTVICIFTRDATMIRRGVTGPELEALLRDTILSDEFVTFSVTQEAAA